MERRQEQIDDTRWPVRVLRLKFVRGECRHHFACMRGPTFGPAVPNEGNASTFPHFVQRSHCVLTSFSDKLAPLIFIRSASDPGERICQAQQGYAQLPGVSTAR
jgi:hypothetical protein